MSTEQASLSMSEGRIDISGFRLVALTAMMLLSFSAAIGMAFNITAIVDSFVVSNTAAGLVATIEMSGVAAGSLVFSQIAPRLDPHRTYMAAIGAIIAMTGLTIWAPSIEFLYVLRGLNGLCAGAVIATVMSTAGRAEAPEATFGVINSAVGVMGMILAIILPQALKLHLFEGMAGLSAADGLYVVYLLFAAAAIGFIRFVPVAPQLKNETHESTPAPELPLMGWAALLGLGMIFFGHGTLVMFIVSVGTEQVKLSPETVGIVFMFGSIFGVVAPLAAGYVGTHYKAMAPLAGIVAAILVFAFLLAQASTPLVFYLTAPFFAMMPIAMMPIALGALARLDPSGRLAGAHPAFVTFGAALAPLAGGAVSAAGDYSANGWLVIICCLIGAALMFSAVRDADRLRDGRPIQAVVPGE